MSHASPVPRPLPESSKDAEPLLFHFDQAWRNHTSPRIDDYLPRLQPAAKPPEARQFLEDLIKIDLEYRWRQPPPGPGPVPSGPRLEDYVGRYPQLGALDELSAALIGEEYLVRQLWGDQPRQAEYVSRFPRHGAKLLTELAKIDAEMASDLTRNGIQAHGPPAASLTSAAALAATLTRCGLLTASQQFELTGNLVARFSEPRALARELLSRHWLTAYQVNQLLLGRGPELALGPYLLVERLGEGGAGQVFKARHRRLDRLVALKLIRKQLLSDPEVVGRFYREIQILSQLDHPNVVHAYDAGPAGATHFLAMEFVEGTDLGKLVKRGGPMPVLQACAYVRQAALGLQHAHERGLVHRDIKPHNLIMSVRDGLIKVADLGLARLPRAMNEEATAAVGGARTTGTLTPEDAGMMGTADYLAPEQALDFHKADIRADIYSLGCTVYFLLTGHPPFPGGNIAQKVAKHLQAEPPPVEQIRKDLPAGLAAVVRKMLAKRPDDRYQTPAEVAEALAPLAPTDPASREHKRPEHGGRIRRLAPLAGLFRSRRAALVVFAVLLVGLAAGLAFRSFWLAPGSGGERPGNAIAHAPRLERSFPLVKQGYLHAVAFSRNGKLVASGGGDTVVTLWDLATGEKLFTLPGHKGAISHLAFSLDSRLLASGSSEGQEWKLWDLGARQELAAATTEAKVHPSMAFVGPFSPDGKSLAVRLAKETFGVLDVASKKSVATFEKIDATALAFTPDSRSLVVASGQLRVYDLANAKEKPATYFVGGSFVHSLGYSRDGALLAVGAWGNHVHVLDAATFKPRSICKGHTDGVVALAFDPEGKLLVTGGYDKTVRLWETADGKALAVLGDREGYTVAISAVAFSPDGKTFVTAGNDDIVRVWRVRE